MYTYALLEPGCYYLVQETPEGPVITIKVAVESDHCLYITRYQEMAESVWKKKTDALFDIIECLTDEKVKEWEAAYKEGWDAYHEEEEDDED
jgi:hypothetical protein